MAATMLSSLLGALVGALLIACVILLAFRAFWPTAPRFANAWHAAFWASAAVILADAFGSALLPSDGVLPALVILIVGMAGAFVAYDRVLATPEGERLGRRAAALALTTHAAFSLAMFLLVFPVVMELFM
jgi:hypothetical protein